jgi:hypothetical protein
MPSDKRARKRAAREAKLAAQQRAEAPLERMRNGPSPWSSGGRGRRDRMPGQRRHNKKKPAKPGRSGNHVDHDHEQHDHHDQHHHDADAAWPRPPPTRAAVAAGCPASTTTTLNKPKYKTARP